MSQCPHSRALNRQTLFLQSWLFTKALPFWQKFGFDPTTSQAIESLAPTSPHPIENLRRSRVTARQIYAFCEARNLALASGINWGDDLSAALLSTTQQAAHCMITKLCNGDGTLSHLTGTDGQIENDGPDLYDQSFFLLALAYLQRMKLNEDAPRRVRDLTQIIEQNFANSAGGYFDSPAAKLPIRANPHMHLLEASLAWCENDDHFSKGLKHNYNKELSKYFHNLAEKITTLCLDRFISSENGALCEYFDASLNPAPLPGQNFPALYLCEPGHCFEWAWLLLRCFIRRIPANNSAGIRARADQNLDALLRAATGLIEFAEAFGVDPLRNVAVNQLDLRGNMLDKRARFWPQTERLKAWLLAGRLRIWLERQGSQQALLLPKQTISMENAVCSANKILEYLGYNAPSPDSLLGGDLALGRTNLLIEGCWFDQCMEDGTFADEAVPASTFYHIVAAIAELSHFDRYLQAASP